MKSECLGKHEHDGVGGSCDQTRWFLWDGVTDYADTKVGRKVLGLNRELKDKNISLDDWLWAIVHSDVKGRFQIVVTMTKEDYRPPYQRRVPDGVHGCEAQKRKQDDIGVMVRSH